MTILKSSLFTVFDVLVITSCAPKLGPILYDPLAYESQNSLKSEDTPPEDSSDDWLTADRRTDTKSPTDEVHKKSCQGYDYDVTQCKFINDRKICGYNKNKGEPQTEEIQDMGNGCRIRNNRLECGYLTGPFKPLRRPPANDHETDNAQIEKLRLSVTRTSKKDLRNSEQAITTKTTAIQEIVPLENADDIEVRTKRNLNESDVLTSKILNTTPNIFTTLTDANKENIKQHKKYCVEKSDRIFCYNAT